MGECMEETDLLELVGALANFSLSREVLEELRKTPVPTPLPHNFMCVRGHVHPVTSYKELLHGYAPRCLLEGIVLEWCALGEALGE
jgi:hypothetical protein